MFFQPKGIFFFISPWNVCCGYSLEAPHPGASNEYPQHIFSWRNKNIYLKPLLSRAISYLYLNYPCLRSVISSSTLSDGLSFCFWMVNCSLAVWKVTITGHKNLDLLYWQVIKIFISLVQRLFFSNQKLLILYIHKLQNSYSQIWI